MRSIGLFVIDLTLVIVATLGALALRNDFAIPLERLEAFLPYLGSTLLSAGVVIAGFGLHRSIWGLSSFREFERITIAGLLIVAGAFTIGFSFDRLEGVPRSVPALQAVLVVGLMLAVRGIARRLRRQRQGRGIPVGAVRATFGDGHPTVLIVGINAITELLLKGIQELGDHEIEVAGILGRSERQVGRRMQTHRVLGLPEDIRSVLRDLEIEGLVVDRIALAVPTGKLSRQAREAIAEIEAEGAIVVQRLADQLGLDGRVTASVAAEEVSRVRDFVFSAAELALIDGRSYWRWKRALDFAAAATLLVIAAPLILIVALAVLIDVGAPILFCQRRPGLRGRPFKLYKFRSMAAAYDRNGNRIDDDKRSSWIGHLLRRTRLDELPQLYNVLIGDMSFVGPRPLLPVDQAPEYRARLLVRPGITGWAQVKGGRAIGAMDKAALDVWYVQKASLLVDIKVALLTIPMVLRGERIDQKAVARAWRDLEPTGICGDWRALEKAAAGGGEIERSRAA